MAEHGHSHAPANFNRAFAIGIALNIGFVAIEAFYGWRVDSLALLADAGHNLSDVAGLVLAWGAAFAGRLAPDHRHTYGWRRASILAAFANAILLLVAMGSLA
jgi:cobalt-zinc-cadmium efflux system protein